MDVRCRFCGEPWDLDELHYLDVRDLHALGLHSVPMKAHGKAPDLEAYPTFEFAYRAFRKFGCRVFGTTCGNETADPRIGTALDLLGDDADGAALILEELS